MRVIGIGVACLALFSVAACDDSTTTLPLVTVDGGARDAAPGDAVVSGDATTAVTEIHALDNRFEPVTISVKVGTKVEWKNVGLHDHTVTSGAGSAVADNPGLVFDQTLAPGATFAHTFDTVGTQPYFCRFHEALGMKGSVVVTP